VRIIDAETHPISPAGLDRCYPMDQPWRYPYIPGHLPGSGKILASSLAEGRYDDESATLLERMDLHGVEKSVIMRSAFPIRNADLAALVRKHPDRFVGFASWESQSASTTPGVTASELDALEAGLTEYGFLGVGEDNLRRFAPLPPEQAYTGYIPIFEVCQKYRAPILFHTGYDGGSGLLLYRNPIYLEPLAAEFPEVPLIVAHMGKYDTWFFEAALMLARKYRQVYLLTSNTRREFVERAVEEVGAERLIWGSDWSMQHGVLGLRQGFDVHQLNLDVIRSARLSESQQAMILGENLATLLQI
jgi:predicted TIM-barrel fold metal-dependent hydrolase